MKRALRTRMRLLELIDRFLTLLGRSSSNVDGRVVLVEDLGELPADARVATGYDEDLVGVSIDVGMRLER